MYRRVVITGMGIISPLATGLNLFWQGLTQGKNGIGPITLFDSAPFPVKIAGEVKNFDAEKLIDAKEASKMDRFTQFGVIAAEEAIHQSNIQNDNIQNDRVGVLIASGIGGIGTFSEQQDLLREKGHRRVSPFLIPKMIPDITSGHISIKYGFRGLNYSVSSACASANHALALAYRHIQFGDADIIVCGGSEAAVTPLAVAGFSQMRALSKRNSQADKASRPFDKDRDGFVIAEGAGVLVLEELQHALKRGAEIYGEISGIGLSADAHHLTAPHPDARGAIVAMENAIRDAGLKPENIDYINAHGTSTPLNDAIETAAIKKVFGKHSAKLAISSTKSMTGHLLGAAGGVEAIASLMALQTGIIPPTINLKTPDPDCDLDYTPNQAVQKNIQTVISNAFGFGGHNASILFKKY
ncbi:MAG TPA: beta-ketoacyl-[acyl-carrier-protein] synthase II [Candidatus Marinimicrobia bacterium]|nr:beta-ketoacyl-[acyl-carrier-protein] synthase II [Candidatus Neomarinimicrobiota bacterium]